MKKSENEMRENDQMKEVMIMIENKHQSNNEMWRMMTNEMITMKMININENQYSW